MIKFLKTIFVSVVLMFAIMQIANATEQPITPETETPKEYQLKVYIGCKCQLFVEGIKLSVIL